MVNDRGLRQVAVQGNLSGSTTEIVAAAQRDDLTTIRELVKSGKATVNDRDSQNLTPLHYAQLATCRYLIEQGAEVDAVGGDLQATPLQRAARNGYLYVIHLLISHNADPNFTDTQGYNALHLVTHSSYIILLLYLLQRLVNGDALSVDLLLKHGANPNLEDDVSLSPLHWAVVRGNRAILRRLVEGRTPRDMAVKLKNFGAWEHSMEEGGMNEFGVKKAKPLSERNTRVAIFVLPTLFLYHIYHLVNIAVIVTRVLLNKDSYMETVNQSPHFAGIIAGSMTWVGYAWLTRLVTQPPNHPFIHLAFALNMGLSIMLDPATCPRPVNDGEFKAIIKDLALEGRLNGQTFCIQCMAKKPLRSKHCRISDHHCPWIWNCVVGIILFDYLTYEFYVSATAPNNIAADCSPICCVPAAIDSFLRSVSRWSTLQLTWTSVLLVTQFWQVARQPTTLEVSCGATGIQMGHRHHHTVDNDRGDEESEGEGGPKHRHHHVGLCKALSAPGTCGAFLLNLVGLDRFTRGRAAHGLALGSSSARAQNPFDLGLVCNCRDFWTMGKEVGVDYGQVYDVPPEGLEEGKRKRDAEWGEFECDHDSGSRSESLLAK
ncbi:ankyrin [Pisolithus tinctorius]|nr:ankyrin [Pisolithus tinctorius]